jgi:hypothetical protein
MLEEKNDNLLEADGSVNDESQEVTIAENQEIFVQNQEETENVVDVETYVAFEEPVAKEVIESEAEVEAAVESLTVSAVNNPVLFIALCNSLEYSPAKVPCALLLLLRAKLKALIWACKA